MECEFQSPIHQVPLNMQTYRTRRRKPPKLKTWKSLLKPSSYSHCSLCLRPSYTHITGMNAYKCFRISIDAKPDFNDLHVKWYSKQHFLREYVRYALTQHVWVLFCVVSTGGLVSLMSYTCFKPYSSYHIQPNGLQNALRTIFRGMPELTYEAENSR